MARLFDRADTSRDVTISTRTGSVVGVVPDEIGHQSQHLWVRLGLHQPIEPSSIAVTSFLRGEGVTTVSLALAAAASQRGRTLLVDANIARPVLPTDGDHRGLWGIVEDGMAVEDAAIVTDHAGLSILPVGRDVALEQRVELDPSLATQLVEVLSLHYDTIVVDAPSLQEPSAAVAVAAACDASLVVVRHRVTDIEQVQAAADALVDTEFIGVVLNDSRSRTPRWIRRRLGVLS